MPRHPHTHRAGPIGCSGQQHLSKASVGMVLVPLPSCSKDPCPWSNGRSRPDQRPTTRDGQPPTRAPLGSHQDPTKRSLSGVQAQEHVPTEADDVPITGNRRTKDQECVSFVDLALCALKSDTRSSPLGNHCPLKSCRVRATSQSIIVQSASTTESQRSTTDSSASHL